METFALYGWDGPAGAELRKIHREAHLARLAELDAAGRLVLAGPLTDGAGSLVLARFSDAAGAADWLAADAYVVHGVFARTETHPFKQVFPAL
jgi:uncharacterized protein